MANKHTKRCSSLPVIKEKKDKLCLSGWQNYLRIQDWWEGKQTGTIVMGL